MKINLIYLICLLLVCPYSGFSQSNDSLVLAKGRFLSSLNGSISGQRVDSDNLGQTSSSAYAIGTRSGTLIMKNWVLGLNLSLGNEEYENLSGAYDFEDFSIGPWSRYYFGKGLPGSGLLFAELTPYWTSIYQSFTPDTVQSSNFSEVITGRGFGIEPGLGFTYLINRNVGFSLMASYRYSRLSVDIEGSSAVTNGSSMLSIREPRFSFEFQIYLDKFFF
jgi:hypothetical protein